MRNEGKFEDKTQFPRPSLILLDLKLPLMGGLELLKIIKSDPNLMEIPVVVLTSSKEASDISTSYRNGVAGYLVKPVTFEKLVEAISIFDLYWTLSEIP